MSIRGDSVVEVNLEVIGVNLKDNVGVKEDLLSVTIDMESSQEI